MTWDVDWNNSGKQALNLLGEVGYRFNNHWNVFAGPGVGVAGRNTSSGLDWAVQAGVRWVTRLRFFPPPFSIRPEGSDPTARRGVLSRMLGVG